MNDKESITHGRKSHLTTSAFACPICRIDRIRCAVRASYSTRVDADTAATTANERTEYERPIVPYQCRWCEQFHLMEMTTLPQRRRIAKARRKWRTKLAEEESN